MCIRRSAWLRSRPTAAASGRCRPTIWGPMVTAIAPFADPELWLRACTLAALRARDGSVGLEVVSLSALCERGRDYGLGLAPRPMNGGSHDDPQDPASGAAYRRSAAALVARESGAFCSQTRAEKPTCAIRSRMGGPEPCANSPKARSQQNRREELMRLPRSISRRLEERACLFGAIWVVRVARVLVREGLLSRRGAFAACRLSSRLSKRAWRIWRSERARRRSAIWGEPD